MLRKAKNPYLNTLNEWDKKVGQTLVRIRKEMSAKHPDPKKIHNEYDKLILLVGEWNYLARECKLMEKKLRHKK